VKLRHYSSKPIGELYDKSQENLRARFFKPLGLWLSVEIDNPDEDWMDWRKWCQSEEFGIGSMLYEVQLQEDANVLRIDNESDFEKFSEEFKPGYEEIGEQFWLKDGIDWLKVSEQYDGIIIAPYFWEFRFTANWYYPWDCASGSIWKVRAVKDIQLKTENWEANA